MQPMCANIDEDMIMAAMAFGCKVISRKMDLSPKKKGKKSFKIRGPRPRVVKVRFVTP